MGKPPLSFFLSLLYQTWNGTRTTGWRSNRFSGDATKVCQDRRQSLVQVFCSRRTGCLSWVAARIVFTLRAGCLSIACAIQAGRARGAQPWQRRRLRPFRPVDCVVYARCCQARSLCSQLNRDIRYVARAALAVPVANMGLSEFSPTLLSGRVSPFSDALSSTVHNFSPSSPTYSLLLSSPPTEVDVGLVIGEMKQRIFSPLMKKLEETSCLSTLSEAFFTFL